MGLLKQLQPGQILQARVQVATQQGIARLLVGAQQLVARTQVQLRQGEPLQLQVEKGLPQPELKILRNDPVQPLRSLLRSALARQLPPANVQQSIGQLALTPGSTQQSPLVQQVLRVLIPNAPNPSQVNAQTISQAMLHSGLFLEPLLLKGAPSPQDRKLQLLHLLRLLAPEARASGAGGDGQPQAQAQPQATQDQLLNRLLRLVEASVARVQTQQAGSLLADEPGRQVWQFDMPVQLADKLDHLHLRVQRDTQEQDKEHPNGQVWKVEIAFDFDNLGEVFSRINLRGEQLSASFWSQREHTAELIARALPKLEASLLKAGLQVAAVTSLNGRPPRSDIGLNSLLDERA